MFKSRRTCANITGTYALAIISIFCIRKKIYMSCKFVDTSNIHHQIIVFSLAGKRPGTMISRICNFCANTLAYAKSGNGFMQH